MQEPCISGKGVRTEVNPQLQTSASLPHPVLPSTAAPAQGAEQLLTIPAGHPEPHPWVLSQCEWEDSGVIEVEGRVRGLVGLAGCRCRQGATRGIARGRGRLLSERGGHCGGLDVDHPGVHDLTLDLHHLFIVP